MSRESLLEERARVQEALEGVREREREARTAIDQLRARCDAVTEELEARMRAHSDAQLEEQRLSLAREDLLRRAMDDLSLSEFDLLAEFEPEPELRETEVLDGLESTVGGLRRDLDKIGSVNLEAVEELEGVTERLGFLEEQRSDVFRARAALLNTIKTINEESERLFLEAFHEIRRHFETLFRQLFGGGRATVELAADEPVLEAGIEISARPPGREMLPLGLLSGGQRTMTALGLLFAVFQSRPSPFCVLDEVDAALDDANIGRFLVLLDGFTRESDFATQFVVVTHNKGTMSACDSLYGITMETKGVSRQVSVELSDVDEFVPEVAGDATAAQDARREVVEATPEDDEDAEDAGEPIVELVPVAAPVALDEGADSAEETASGDVTDAAEPKPLPHG